MKNYKFNEALWSAVSDPGPRFTKLSSDIEVDVAIVGAGITGLSTAYYLKKEGKKIAILEAGRVGMGTTGSSTGNIYVPTGQLHEIISKHDRKALDSTMATRSAALQFVEDRINEFHIDCGFRKVPWYFFTANSGESKQRIRQEFEAAEKGRLKPREKSPEDFPFPQTSLAVIDNQAQFNPLQYVRQFASAIEDESCRIYEDTKVQNIEDGSPCVLDTEGGKIRAAKVVQATHTPKGVYAVHSQMLAYREFAIAAKINGSLPADAIYWNLEGDSLYSIRTYQDLTGSYIVVLDDSRIVGHKVHTEESFMKVENYLRNFFELEEISYLWAAQNYQPADGLPYIGTSPLEKNIIIATGFGPDGLIWGTAAGALIKDLITGRENPGLKVFDPARFTPAASARKFSKEVMHVSSHLLKDNLLNKNKEKISEIKPGQGKIVEFNKEKAAVFKDENGDFHAVSAVCPHMYCNVHWNSAERSWDCPCHGSRFSIDGEVLEGPAFGGLRRYE